MQRTFAIIKTDFLIRFRRPSTVVLFLLLCVAAYMWIPDPSTGRALVQVKEQRALYNSAAIALGTSSLFTILIGLVGYYMVSNSIKRDVQTRTGYVLASTTMKNAEYLIGKFLGNVVFLTAITIGFLLSSMVMQLVRGEAPLEPSFFLAYYFVMVPPIIVFVSAAAILFESVRFLRGKFGDLVYFFVWLSLIAFTAVSTEKQGYPNTGSYMDVTGMGFLLEQVRSITGQNEVAIGSSEYNRSLPPFVFNTFPFRSEWIVPRVASALFPLPLLFLALPFFHRFNPAKLKSAANKARLNILGRINALLKPLSVKILSPLFAMASGKQSRATFMRSVFAEAALTLQLYPLAVIMILVFTPLALLSSMPVLKQTLLPVMFVGIAFVLCDLSTREKNAGTLASIYSAPRLQTNFVWWKFAASFILVVALSGVAVLKVALVEPSMLGALLSGLLFTAAAAISLGILSSNPKTFIVLFLMFMYLVMNDKGRNPGFDFAGWFGTATPAVSAGYLAAALLAMASAAAFHGWRLRRSNQM